MPDLGSSVTTTQTYNSPTGSTGAFGIGSQGGTYLTCTSTRQPGSQLHPTNEYHEKTTPGQRIYSTYIPYP